MTSNPSPSTSVSRRRTGPLVRYLAGLSLPRFILWCYFIYWMVVVVRYFDAHATLWLTSLGLSGIIGCALFLNTQSGKSGTRLGAWPIFRLFVTPFCVSSFSALVKGKDFFLIFSPNPWETAVAVALCGALGGAAWSARRILTVKR